MYRVRTVVALLVLALVGGASFQEKDKDKKADDKTAPSARPQLPAHYKKLGLRDDQRAKILKLRGDYKGRQDALKRQMDRLRDEEKEAIEKVLTPEQLKRLKELRSGEKPSDK